MFYNINNMFTKNNKRGVIMGIDNYRCRYMVGAISKVSMIKNNKKEKEENKFQKNNNNVSSFKDILDKIINEK